LSHLQPRRLWPSTPGSESYSTNCTAPGAGATSSRAIRFPNRRAGGSYVPPPAPKQAIVDGITASKPMPKAPQWPEINRAVTQVLATVRAGTVAGRKGLADIDRRVTAALKAR